jgi:hypothetical protein
MKKLYLTVLLLFVSISGYCAELIVMKEDHWMRQIPEELWEEHGITQEEYDRQPVKGTIISIRENGYIKHGFSKESRLAAIKIEGLEVDKTYTDRVINVSKIENSYFLLSTFINMLK